MVNGKEIRISLIDQVAGINSNQSDNDIEEDAGEVAHE